MKTHNNLIKALNFVNQQCYDTFKDNGKIDTKELKNALIIIKHTYIKVSEKNIKKLNSNLKILIVHAKDNSLKKIINRCLSLTDTNANYTAPERVVNHPAYFVNTIKKGKEINKFGLDIRSTPEDTKRAYERAFDQIYIEDCLKKAFEREKNIIDSRHTNGRVKNVPHRLFLLRDSSADKNTEDIEFFVVSYINCDTTSKKVEHSLCGYDSNTKKYNRYETDKDGNIIRSSTTKKNFYDFLRAVIGGSNVHFIRQEKYKVEDFSKSCNVYS